MFNDSSKTFSTLVDFTEDFFLQILFRLIFGFALLYFLWHAYGLIKDGGNATKRKDHQNAIMWSVIAFAVMFSVWALVAVVTGTFGEPNVLPQINQQYIDTNRPR